METINSIISMIPVMDISLSELKIFNIRLIDIEDFIELIARFGLNLIVCLVIVRVLYYNATRRKDYLFTYILISTTVFLLCFLLESVKLELGFALGLFAVFGIIRYRTTTIPIKEMTYLFIIIGLSVINALSNKKVSYAELLFTNMAIIAIVWGLERIWLLKNETRKTIIFEKIDLIRPENYKLLLDDLKERTGLIINRAEVGKINFLRDTAEVKIYYFNGTEIHEEDEFTYDQEMI
ncbi:MAG: DUF4956 domain-containing protein [Bacteroidales bacterium]|jgi:hypothetical protein|nr:DUF4956 domain-containing protein [Bacteroidales bacterium]